jgi:formylglycine-generating enzyme required for sulfatase activity
MSAIEGGTLKLGDEVDVMLTRYCLDQHEVTVADYAGCVKMGRCTVPSPPPPGLRNDIACNWSLVDKPEHPINCVTWQQASDYCRYVDKQLPTEAQWEYAARAGSKSFAYPWGNEEPSEDRACWDANRTRKGTCRIASYPASAFGLHDMAGNVSEWVRDFYEPYPAKTGVNYSGPSSGSQRVSRGGAWLVANPNWMRGIARSQRELDYHGDAVGLRCASVTPLDHH